jgi:hypothetical protein
LLVNGPAHLISGALVAASGGVGRRQVAGLARELLRIRLGRLIPKVGEEYLGAFIVVVWRRHAKPQVAHYVHGGIVGRGRERAPKSTGETTGSAVKRPFVIGRGLCLKSARC